MMKAINMFWNKFALALLNHSMNYNQTHNFLSTSDQVIENIGNCKQFRLVINQSNVITVKRNSPFLYKKSCFIVDLVSGYLQVSGAGQVIGLITSNLQVPIR